MLGRQKDHEGPSYTGLVRFELSIETNRDHTTGHVLERSAILHHGASRVITATISNGDLLELPFGDTGHAKNMATLRVMLDSGHSVSPPEIEINLR